MSDPLLILGILVTILTLGGYGVVLHRRIASAEERQAALAEHLVDATSDEDRAA